MVYLVRCRKTKEINKTVHFAHSFYALNKTGSWNAMMWDSGSSVGLWVVVNGVDDAGRVIVSDPFNGGQYKMDVDKFKEVWNGHAFYKQ